MMIEHQCLNLFNPSNLVIDSHMLDKLKDKIWTMSSYFGSLLFHNGNSTKYQVAFRNSDGDNTPSRCLEPVNRANRIFNSNTWVQPFRIFVWVYTCRFPIEAPGSMKYGEIIQDLASRGNNWGNKSIMSPIFLAPLFAAQ